MRFVSKYVCKLWSCPWDVITYVYPGTYLSAAFHLISVFGTMPLLTGQPEGCQSRKNNINANDTLCCYSPVEISILKLYSLTFLLFMFSFCLSLCFCLKCFSCQLSALSFHRKTGKKVTDIAITGERIGKELQNSLKKKPIHVLHLWFHFNKQCASLYIWHNDEIWQL